MIILVIDTSSNFCNCGIFENKEVIYEERKYVGMGHAEYIIDQITSVMHQSKKNFSDIDLISVNIGPGSFTGTRVGISSARGLSLAIKKQAIGISVFQVLAFEANEFYKKKCIKVILEIYHNKFYVQDFIDNVALNKPRIFTEENFVKNLETTSILVGSGAPKIGKLIKDSHLILDLQPTGNIKTYATLAKSSKDSTDSPYPIYIEQKYSSL